MIQLAFLVELGVFLPLKVSVTNTWRQKFPS